MLLTTVIYLLAGCVYAGMSRRPGQQRYVRVVAWTFFMAAVAGLLALLGDDPAAELASHMLGTVAVVLSVHRAVVASSWKAKRRQSVR